MTYRLVVARPAARALTEDLPEAVATAALELITGALLDNPQWLSRRLRDPLSDLYVARRGQYRVVYSRDDGSAVVTVREVSRRRGAHQ